MHILDVYNRLPVNIISGKGVYIYDENGKSYLDFTSGLGAVALGHCNPYIVEKLKLQLDCLWHCSNLFHINHQEALAERITNITFADKVFFCSSGLEAVETLIKSVKRYFYVKNQKEKYRIITLNDGFHGRSLACISAGGNIKSKEGYTPLLDGFDTVPKNSITAIKKAINKNTAAILLEPIQAEGGVCSLDNEYLKTLRDIADENELLLCFDEVQCGYGRSGMLFKYQKVGIEPDILTAAKAMGNGFPIAGCLMKSHVADVMTKSSHGSTYGGNPMAMVVGNAVLDIILSNGFLNQVNSTSEYLIEMLSSIKQKFPDIISDITGEGMIIGITLKNNDYREKLIFNALDNGLAITRTAKESMIRLLPPIIIEKKHVDEACKMIQMSLTQIQMTL